MRAASEIIMESAHVVFIVLQTLLVSRKLSPYRQGHQNIERLNNVAEITEFVHSRKEIGRPIPASIGHDLRHHSRGLGLGQHWKRKYPGHMADLMRARGRDETA